MAFQRLSRLQAHLCAGQEPEPEVIAEVSETVARLHLNRPKALNALTVNMCELLLGYIKQWHANPSINVILLTAAGKVFSAGGDVKSTILDGRSGGTMYYHQFAMEYTLMHWVKKCDKPQVALIDGPTLGCGAGLVVHGHFRIVTERATLTMPETGIGIFPDVGMSFVFARLRSHLGVFAGLTSYRFNAKELISTGLATHFVPSNVLASLETALRQEAFSSGKDVNGIASIIERFSCEPPGSMQSPLLDHEAVIDRCFNHNTVQKIVHALHQEEEHGDPVSTAWATEILKTLRQKSPTSLHITLHAMHLNQLPGASLDEALKLDYRMIVACAGRRPHGDFYEGVRAVLIDKTGDANWSPATVDDVTPDLVQLHFQNLGDKELLF